MGGVDGRRGCAGSSIEVILVLSELKESLL